MRHRCIAASIGSVLLATAMPAQRVLSSMDVSATGVWYADSVRSAGSSVSPALRIDWPNVTIGAFGNVSHVGGGLSAQGSLTPSLFSPSIGPFSGELSASLGGSTHADGTRTGQALGVVRAYAARTDAGAWVGGGIGNTWDGAVWRDVRQAEVGAWTHVRRLTTLATVTPVVVADSLRYTDFQAALRYPAPMFELGLTVGARSGSVGSAIGGTSRAWGNASAMVWLSSSLAIVGSAGSYPVDLTQGYPGGRFVTVALRVASRNSRTTFREPEAQRTETGHAVIVPDAPSVSDFDVVATAGTRRTIRLRAPSARIVEINADFTQWRATPLVRGADGSWSVTLPISAGTHQFNIRVDGGPWVVPPGVLGVTDEFGGSVGVLSFK